MFAAYGPAPLCLDLDFDTFEGPWQHIARFRRRSGWLLVARCTIQSEHDLLTTRILAACDEAEQPIPSFKALHLTQCEWRNARECDEPPPGVLDDIVCGEEGAALARWHREKNADLAAAFDRQEARVAELEGRVGALLRRNERRIAQLRQRRRHHQATPEIRAALSQIIIELDAENEALLAEMASTRAVMRRQAKTLEDRLWARDDVLIEVEPLHLVQWRDGRRSHREPVYVPRQYGTLFIPACGRTGGTMPDVDGTVKAAAQSLAAKAAAAAAAKEPPALPKHSPALRRMAASADTNQLPDPAPPGWTAERVALLEEMWLAGKSASTIAAVLGGTSRNAVIGKADRLGLPSTKRSGPPHCERQPAQGASLAPQASPAQRNALAALAAAQRRYYGRD